MSGTIRSDPIDAADLAPLRDADVGPFVDSSSLRHDAPALRERAGRDGFLFFRGLLPVEPIIELRRRVLDVLGAFKLRAAGASGDSGRLDLDVLYALPSEDFREDIGVSAEIYFALQRLPELHRLPQHRALIAMYEQLLGGPILVHPRHILRAMTSHPATGATPAHQDFPLIQGSLDTWTCWFPIGDCSMDLGPLAVLRGSHRDGYLPVGSGTDARYWTEWGVQLCPDETDWVSGDFAAGDVLTFPSTTVHRGVPASRRDEIRLSLDVRYQRRCDPIEEQALTNHSQHPWPEIYADWTADDADLMYYWQDSALEFSPWDESLMQPSTRRIC